MRRRCSTSMARRATWAWSRSKCEAWCVASLGASGVWYLRRWAGAPQVQHEYGETGDLGLVAFNARATQRTMFPLPPLSIASVFQCAAPLWRPARAAHHAPGHSPLLASVLLGTCAW